jgi:hypothetical protein
MAPGSDFYAKYNHIRGISGGVLLPVAAAAPTPIWRGYRTLARKPSPSSWTNWATPGAGVVVCRVLYSDGKEYNVDPKIVEKLFQLDFSQVSKYGEEWGTLGFDPQQK